MNTICARIFRCLLLIITISPLLHAQDMGDEERAFLEFIEALAKEIEKEQFNTIAEEELSPAPIPERVAPTIPDYLDPTKDTVLPLSLTDKRANFLTSFVPPTPKKTIATPGQKQAEPPLAELPPLQYEALIYYVELFVDQLQKIESILAQFPKPKQILFNRAITQKSNGTVLPAILLARMQSTLENIKSKSAYRLMLYDPAFVALRDRIVRYVETLKSLRADINLSDITTMKTRRALEKLQTIIATEFPSLEKELASVITQASKSIEERKAFREKRYKQMQEQFKRINENIARQEQAARWRQSYSRDQGRRGEPSTYPRDYGKPYTDGGWGSDGFISPWDRFGEEESGGRETTTPELPLKDKEDKEKPKKPEEPESKPLGVYVNLVKRFEGMVNDATNASDATRNDLIDKARSYLDRIDEAEIKISPKVQKTKQFLTTKAKFKAAKEKLKKIKRSEIKPDDGKKPEEQKIEPPAEEPTRAPRGPKPGTLRNNFPTYTSLSDGLNQFMQVLSQGAKADHAAYSGYYALYNALCLTLDTEPFSKNNLANRVVFTKWLDIWENEIVTRRRAARGHGFDNLTIDELAALRDFTIDRPELAIPAADKKAFKQRILFLRTSDDRLELPNLTLELGIGEILNALRDFAGASRPLTFLIDSGSVPVELLDAPDSGAHWITESFFRYAGKTQFIIADSLGKPDRHLTSAEAIKFGIDNPDRVALRANQMLLLSELDALFTLLQPLWTMQQNRNYDLAETQEVLREMTRRWEACKARSLVALEDIRTHLGAVLIDAIVDAGNNFSKLINSLPVSDPLTDAQKTELDTVIAQFDNAITSLIAALETQLTLPGK